MKTWRFLQVSTASLLFCILSMFCVFGLSACATSTSTAAVTAAEKLEPVPSHESFTFQSQYTQEARVINVYLPPSYAKDTGIKFPVLYMPDGGVKEDFPHVAYAIDQAIRRGEISPRIVVGIENTERRRDLTGPTSVREDKEMAPRVGGSEKFRLFIQKELFPVIEAKYHVTQSRAIIGESLAGLFVVETFFKEPQMFDTYIALSPSLWWNNQKLVKEAQGRLKEMGNLRATLDLTSANETDIAPQVEKLGEILTAVAPKELQWSVKVHPELRHNNIYQTLAPSIIKKHFSLNAATSNEKLDAKE